ncbi:MAG: zinc transporter ZupT [Bacteroidia bacterium]|jgi:zinc transporter ZupT
MIESTVLFIGSLLAGLSALAFKPSERLFKVLLAFGGAFLLGLSFFHLLPEAYEAIGMQAGIAVIAGFLLQVVLESFSGGIEHGHHHHKEGNNFPWMVFVGLSLHAYLEGLPFGQHDHGHGLWPFLIGVMMHKMPVAFVLGSMLVGAGSDKMKVILFIVIFSCMAPMGSLTTSMIPTIDESIFYMIIGVVVGMLLHISTTILYEADKGHRFNFLKMLVIIIALAVAYFVSII